MIIRSRLETKLVQKWEPRLLEGLEDTNKRIGMAFFLRTKRQLIDESSRVEVVLKNMCYLPLVRRIFGELARLR